MRVPISWLREYVDLPKDSQAIADRLAMLGFPVEEIVVRPKITGVVVGKIVALEKHPNADRLQVGTIDIGAEKTLTIATAATNVAAGQVISVATIGAQLPSMKIEPRKMRGIDSEGMMISAEELALPGEWFEDGIMQLEADTTLGANTIELFGLDDDILEVEVTSNRVDAMSVLGLARELAASYGVALREPSFVNPGVDDDGAKAPRVTLESPDCIRFVAQSFDNVRVGPAPAWMRVRLALAGQRPINNLVDISNYVMFEMSQPSHFYDAEQVAGRHFIVRDAKDGEMLKTLDDVERKLTPLSLVVADEKQALGLGGLMGGEASEVRDETTSLLLEAANWDGARVRRMGMQLALRSEASSRNEKSLAFALPDMGAARAAQLLVQTGAHAYAPHTFGSDVKAAEPIALTTRDVKRLLGLDLSANRIASHLTRLGCEVKQNGDTLAVTPPNFRRDLTISNDLVEEVARIEGYDAIEAIEPSVPAHEISSIEYEIENKLADTLAGLGYHEILNYSLIGPQTLERLARIGLKSSHKILEVRNPLSEDQRYLRWALGGGMMEYCARVDAPIRIFEIGHVFSADEQPYAEFPVLTFGFTIAPTSENPWQDTHFLRLKGDAEAVIRRVTGDVQLEAVRDRRTGFHPGICAVLMHDGGEVASLGKVDPRLSKVFDVKYPMYLCNIYLDKLPEYAMPRYKPSSRFPSTYRDLALVVELDVTAERITSVARKAIGEWCLGVRAFDEYRGKQVGDGHKSLAIRATIGKYDGTITDAEADDVMKRVVEALRSDVGAVVRE